MSLTLAALALPAVAADACKNRGELDTMYCDDNNDMVADVPADAKKLKNPSTIVFTYTPVEDPAVYENIFKPFTTHLAACLNKKVVFYQVQSNAAEIEAMRSGRLHVGGFSTGPTAFAVNLAGAVPFAIKGTAKEFQGYNLIVVVKASSPYQKLSDLKGKKVAHTSPSSNSGHLAPMSLFPAQGLTPDKDYKIIFSGKHDQSVMGVNSGRLRRGSRRLRRLSTAWRAWPDQGERLPRDLPEPEVPDLVVRLRPRSRPEARRQDARLLLRLPLPARDAEGLRRRRSLLPDQLQDELGGRARSGQGLGPGRSTSRPTKRKRRASS
jgi:phosphate/phosphite/phosphonate ABC transporter binding protein